MEQDSKTISPSQPGTQAAGILGSERAGDVHGRLSELEAALEQQNTRLVQAQHEIDGYRRALERQMLLKHELERKLQREKGKAKREVARLTREVELYRMQLRDVYGSRSWRLSYPVRRISALLKGGSSISDMELQVRALAAPAATPVPVPEDPAEAAARRARSEVRATKSRMLKLGFLERGRADLQAYVDQEEDSYLRRIAAWELAVWHANQYSPEDSRLALGYLDVFESGEADSQALRRAAVLRAECLSMTGDREAARSVLEETARTDRHPDLFLGLCTLADSDQHRLELINSALAVTGLAPIELCEGAAASVYDRMHGSGAENVPGEEARVSVIVPSYNAEATIDTTLRALTAQTWRNLEIIVSDDCSTDQTCAIVEQWMRQDKRVRLLRGEANSGPYVARNRALQAATGLLVTCNDADDWSHPRKIELQAKHLVDNPGVIANTSEQARVSETLEFYRRGNAGFYVQPNMSSLMFRRIEVVGRIGYWDSVRFAADSEYTRRIKKVFGAGAIVDLATGPLSFQRQTSGSLTGSQTFGYHGFKMGARREYELGHKRFHAAEDTPYVDFPLERRPFVVPEPMRPKREHRPEGVRSFDVIIVSDFRMPGGTSMSNVEEIKAQRRLGLRTGLVQMCRYDVNPERGINPAVQALIDGESVDMVVYGESARCDLMVLRLPWVLEEWQQYIPNVTAKSIAVIVNQPPKRDYGPESPYIYHLQRCRTHLERYFGQTGTWYPIGPLVRQALLAHHRDELIGIDLSPDDWPNIIDINEWRRPLRPRKRERIRICRVSRDQYVKWPADPEQLLQAYPDSPRFEVHILGGATTPAKLLGDKLPKHWHVTEFGKVRPARFLARHDVFVYYTHPDWVESFGRVIFEAMAVGLPVVLPPIYKPLFKDAAVYAEPRDVVARVEELMADDSVYESQVQRALAFVEGNFGHGEHGRRIESLTGRSIEAVNLADPFDVKEFALGGEPSTLSSFDLKALDAVARSELPEIRALREQVVAHAEKALQVPSYSVTHKTTLPPSGNPHDYWHPAPYWWPNPHTPDGLPYVRRDGERVPGTLMFEPDSNKYDRTGVQGLFDNSLALMLGWYFTRRVAYAEKAVANLATFFVNEDTRMNPHLEFAQVKLGHNDNRGSSSGLIELKDFYYYLDAVRLMELSGALPAAMLDEFRAWLSSYLHWLVASPQGRTEQNASNNHGTYYDLQVGAISGFLGERACLLQTLRRARARIAAQFDLDGSQPEELTRQTTAHYCCYNLQGWINLSRLAQRWGLELWDADGQTDSRLQAGVEWLLSHMGSPWPYPQIDSFDEERFWPIVFDQPRFAGTEGDRFNGVSKYEIKALFHPHDGVRPYWNLG